jgi:hypothetical protein
VQLENGVDVLLVEDSNRHEPSEQAEHNAESDRSKQGSRKNSEWLPPNITDDEGYDPTCACAVVLRIGSFSDPPELQVWAT